MGRIRLRARTGRTGDRKFVATLGGSLSGGDSPRREIILALRELGDPKGAKYIGNIFSFLSAEWAPLAVVAVEKLDAAGNVEFFKGAVHSPSPDVVARALEAIEKVGNASCVWYVEDTLKRTDLPEPVMAQARRALAALRARS